jgi:acetyl esterase/lipase
MSSSHPTFPPYSFADAGSEVTTSLIKYGDDADQLLEFYGDVNPDRPTLVLIHGGYWRNLFDREHMRPLAVALAKLGFSVVLPEFRRVAGNPDTTIRDLSFAISTLADLNLTIIGYSSGGHLALLLADKFPAVKVVVGLAPVTDLVESQKRELGRGAVLEWLGTEADQAPELDPMLRSPIKAKAIFIQGDSDERVPLDITESYIKAMAAHGKKIELHILANTSHFEMMNVPSATFTAILQSIS